MHTAFDLNQAERLAEQGSPFAYRGRELQGWVLDLPGLHTLYVEELTPPGAANPRCSS